MRAHRAFLFLALAAAACGPGADPSGGAASTDAGPAASRAPGSGAGTAAIVAISTSNGNLFRWTRPTPTSGSFSSSTQVGQSWSGIRLIASESAAGNLYAVDSSGNLRLYKFNGSAYGGGGVIDTGWGNITQLVAGGNGVLYARHANGDLLWYRYHEGSWTDDDGTVHGGAGWVAGSGNRIGAGWNGFSRIFGAGNGILYGIRSSDGALLWYRHLSPGIFSASWANAGSGKQVGSGWGSMRAVVGLGGGVIYAVDGSGRLLLYTHTGYPTGAATWGNGGSGQQIGSDWTGYDRITANPDALAIPAPERADGVERPLYLVHGIVMGASGYDVASYWSDTVGRFRALGWKGPIKTVGFYTGDTQYDVLLLRGTVDTDIDELAKKLAWLLYDRHAIFGQPVEVVAHSMGGLIVRAAIAGTEAGVSGFPPYLYVENVATLGTPHQGTPLATLAAWILGTGSTSPVPLQGAQLAQGSSFMTYLNSLSSNPQSSCGTDWTLLGAVSDELVPVASALGQALDEQGNLRAGHMDAGHLVFYEDPAQLRPLAAGWTPPVHMSLVHAAGTTGLTLSYHDWHLQQHGPSASWFDTSDPAYWYSWTDWYRWSSGPRPVDWAFSAVSSWETW